MGRKKILEKRMARLLKKKEDLTARALASEDAGEVRNINAQLSELAEEIAETQEEINLCDEEERNANPIPPTNAQVVNGGVGLASYSQNPNPAQERSTDPFATVEYRTAFMAYAQRGVQIPDELTQRAGGDAGPTVSSELGAIIPTTVMNEFIEKVSKVYGHIYSKVRKLNVPGGVKFPVADLKATFKWVTETKASDRQKAGDINTYVEFSYNLGEVRVSQTLLSQIVSLSVFETKLVEIMTEAYVEAMDKGIMLGTGSGQMQGVLTDTRVTSQDGHVIEMTEAEFSSWEKWRKKLFAIIPLSKRRNGEFIFSAGTVESNLLTMKDAQDRPIYREATELTVGDKDGSFFGREVTMVEPDVVGDFDTATAGDIVGVYWVPGDYAINTNLAFGIKRYFDEDKNEYVNKGLTIVDGKILDPSGVYIIKKK